MSEIFEDSENIKVIVDIKPYKHKKTGNIYYVFDYDLINATNANEGQEMIFYARLGKFYVREKSEFNEKFELVESAI